MKLIRRVAAFGLLLGLADATPIHAQSASQIVPRTLAPAVPARQAPRLEIDDGGGTQAPADADKLFVALSGLTVENGLPQMAGAEAALRARFSRHRVSGAEIFAAAHNLEIEYARAGYVLARVVLPGQRLVNGAKLRLIVIDGFIENVDLAQVPARVRPQIATRLAALKGVRGLTLRDLERHILLAGDVPGVKLRSALAPGSVTGATILIIEAEYQPIVANVSIDNTLASSLGRYQTGVGADFNGVLGTGELIYLRANGFPNAGRNGYFEHYARNRALAGGIILPVGSNGLTLNAEAIGARTTPRAVSAIQSTDGFARASLRLRYPIIRSRSYDLAISAIVDAENETQSLLANGSPVPLSDDRLRVLRVKGEADWITHGGGSLSASLTASFGLDGLGARSAADATPLLPLSRQGADAQFAKLEATVSYSRLLTRRLTAGLTGRAQTSFGAPLLHAEQFGIAGPGEVSAFDNGVLQGDSGWDARMEIAAPVNALPHSHHFGLVAAPYLFVAGGLIVLNDPTALERRSVRAAAYGLGVRISGGGAGSAITGTIGVELAGRTRNDGDPGGNRLTVVSSFRL